MELTAGHLIAKALKKEGVEYVFTLSGGHIMPIYYGLREVGISVIDTRSEAAAAHAADAYARSSGRPGVVITTAGPGVTNATTAMVEALHTGSPVIHIGGAAPIKESVTGTLQDVNSVEIMAQVCKWSERIIQGERAAEYVAIAFRYALSGTPGPVYLEIGSDIVQQIVMQEEAYMPGKYRAVEHAAGNAVLINQAAELLKRAKKPLLIVGDEARFSCDDNGAVQKLAERLTMPVWTVNVARGLFADEDIPLFKMGFGAAEEADVVLELCARNDFMIGKCQAPTFRKDAKFIQVNSDAMRIGYNANADVGIIGGAGNVARQLLEKLEQVDIPPKTDWLRQARQLNEKAMSRYTSGAKAETMPLHPGRAAGEAAEYLRTQGRDWSIICDGGDTTHWIKNNIKAHVPGQIIEKGPFGTIGSGAGFVLGAWAARQKPILYYTGDGSFGFHAMEFDTYARFNIPVVCIVANDSAWGMIRMAEQSRNPEQIEKGEIALLLSKERRYDLMPQVWGGKGFLVRRAEEIIPAIEEIYATGLPGIINVIIDDKGKSHVTESYGKGLKVK